MGGVRGRESCTWGHLLGNLEWGQGTSKTRLLSFLPAVFRECLGDP